LSRPDKKQKFLLHYSSSSSLLLVILASGRCGSAAGYMAWQALQQQQQQHPDAPVGPQTEVEKQPWLLERQVRLLLPAASSILLSAIGVIKKPSQQRADRLCVDALIEHSNATLSVSDLLHYWSVAEYTLPHPDWAGEVLGGALQLADQLLLQQQPHGQAATEPSLPQLGTSINSRNSDSDSDSSGSSDSGGSSDCSLPSHAPMADRAALAPLLLRTLGLLQRSSITSSTTSPDPCSTHAPGSLAAVATPAVPFLADRVVDVCIVLEAGLRVVTTAVQQGAFYEHFDLIDMCGHYLLEGTYTRTDGGNFPKCLLVQHMGLRGFAAHTQEQLRFYSLLSTIHKLGRCKKTAGHELVWGQQGADTCCWAVAQAAAQLLQAGLSAVGSAALLVAAPAADEQQPVRAVEPGVELAASLAAAAAQQQQQPEVEYLPLSSSGKAVCFGQSSCASRQQSSWCEPLMHQCSNNSSSNPMSLKYPCRTRIRYYTMVQYFHRVQQACACLAG
jgi:hypothetical protein